MNYAKKLISLLLALLMVMSSAGAMAEETASTATVTLGANHTYDAYQIFTGTQATSEGALGDVQWGNGVNSTTLLAALKEIDAFEDCNSAADVAAALSVQADDSDLAKKFANIVAMHLTSEKTAISESVELPVGYYLLVDSTEVADGDAKNSALLHLTDDVTITVKYSVPTLDKDIVENNTEVESTDASIGDTVTFQLTGTLPSNLDDYEKYTYIFRDTMSAGLSLNNDSIKVYLNEVSEESMIQTGENVVIATTGLSDGCTFEVQINDLKNVADVTKDSKIIVQYTATVNSNAVIGSAGNPNEAYIEYSNNPNQAGDGTPETGDTPKDTVLFFTYELDVTKTDDKTENPGKLADAEFVLLSSDQTMVAKVVDGKFVEWLAVPNAADGTVTYPEGTKLTSDANGNFSVYGLDAGTYYLKETKAPAGYNLLTAPIKVVIAAELETSEDKPELKTLTISVGDGAAQNGATNDDGKLTGEVAMTVINNSGATLPETGGVGTTMLYVGGGALIVIAIALLVSKKRKA